MSRKGQWAKLEPHVKEIRERYEQLPQLTQKVWELRKALVEAREEKKRCTLAGMAREYNVHPRSVAQVAKRETYRDD